jgi:chromatin remodeling complex protein RSC6
MKRRLEDVEALERRIQLYADRADLNQDVFTGEPHVNPKKKVTKKKKKATKKKATKKKATKKTDTKKTDTKKKATKKTDTKKKPRQLHLPLG